MARTKTNTRDDTKPLTTSWRNRHLENIYLMFNAIHLPLRTLHCQGHPMFRQKYGTFLKTQFLKVMENAVSIEKTESGVVS